MEIDVQNLKGIQVGDWVESSCLKGYFQVWQIRHCYRDAKDIRMKRHGDGKKFTSLRRSCGLNVGYPIFFFLLTSDIPYCIIVI